MRLFLVILILILIGCKDSPLCGHKQDSKLKPYLDTVHANLVKREIEFSKECVAVVFKDEDYFYIARYHPLGVISFNPWYFDNHTQNGYSRFMEVVMINEVGHHVFGSVEVYTPTQLTYTDEDMEDIYDKFEDTYNQFY